LGVRLPVALVVALGVFETLDMKSSVPMLRLRLLVHPCACHDVKMILERRDSRRWERYGDWWQRFVG